MTNTNILVNVLAALLALLFIAIFRGLWLLRAHPAQTGGRDTSHDILVGLVWLTAAALTAFVLSLILGIS